MKTAGMFVCLLALVMSASCNNNVNNTNVLKPIVIPNVEQWELVSSHVSHNLKYTWHKEPEGHGRGGMVIYHSFNGKDWVPFIKAWNFFDSKTGGGIYHDIHCYTALLQDSGVWVVGGLGERLKFDYIYNAALGETVGITFRFSGNHSHIFRTLFFTAS